MDGVQVEREGEKRGGGHRDSRASQSKESGESAREERGFRGVHRDQVPADAGRNVHREKSVDREVGGGEDEQGLRGEQPRDALRDECDADESHERDDLPYAVHPAS